MIREGVVGVGIYRWVHCACWLQLPVPRHPDLIPRRVTEVWVLKPSGRCCHVVDEEELPHPAAREGTSQEG